MRKIALVLIVLSFVYGCVSVPRYLYYDKIPNSSVAIGTEGVVIKAVDGSFEWVSGNDYKLPETTSYFDWYTTGAALNIKTTDFSKVNETNAVKVMVTTPYASKPLYGMLQFSRIITECKDKAPETRSYYIQVPEQYVRSAQGGKVSVMYESYMCISGHYSNGVKATNEHGYSTWVLWLSDRPL